MSACLVCRADRVEPLLDLGPQPITNRFPLDEREREHLHPLVFGACRACGTAQLIAPPPAAELRPRVDWITYNEPEPHLDGLAERLAKLPGVGPSSVVVGVSGKDDSLLRRLRERGVARTRILDAAEDLGETDRRAFVETIQALLTPEKARAIAARRGGADLVIARHIFEHAGDPAAFARALFALAKPGGLVVVEAPDCTRSLAARDYTMLWEEHSLYLTPETFRHAVELSGGAIELEEVHPYALENSIVLVARAGAAPGAAPGAEAGFAAAKAFANGFELRKSELRAWIEQASLSGRIAMFGAGHLGAVWLNALGVADKISFVIDDNPHKRGRRMPGSRLPILGSEALLDDGVAWALMAFSPDAEDRVMAKNAPFHGRGGRFASIFPGSPNSFEPARR